MEQEINLDELTDMNLLQNLLDQTEDIDDRKAIRGRMQEIRSIERAKRDAKLERLNNSRQEMIDERQRKAAEHKARTLAMYDQMARSAPAGGKKTMDIGIYTTGQVTPPSSPSINDKGLVEDVLQQCKRSAEERKKKILESYSVAARSGPAGAMTKDDPAQEFIRQRQQEAEEDKKRLLKAYDYVSRQGAGPKQVVLEELKRYDVDPGELVEDPRLKKVIGTTSFRDGTSK
ncbi:uncharacterized protein LOC124496713 isoform X2 [Dermatophagoides farinae]|uniref:Uncharacterized protein n=2 Tax=Dermatophagoides farinae TaxID=6954 RepID=A0A9D4NTQ5_DERFA|nr:hypothetical protein HUG17_8871 [Dermatophagoides farinae]